MFIDIHNHVISGLDDGAESIEESIQMLKRALDNNIKKLIVTPHYRENIYENDKAIINHKLTELKNLINKNQIDIELYPGSEIFLSKNTSGLLREGSLQTLNNTKYILIELYPISKYNAFNFMEELYNLSLDGYKIILAHVERYDFTHENPNMIYDLVNEGFYMQINVNSLKPHHPNYKASKKLLDHNLVQFIASDAHSYLARPLELQNGYNCVKRKYGEERANRLFYENPLKIIEDKEIDIGEIKKIKKRKFLFI